VVFSSQFPVRCIAGTQMEQAPMKFNNPPTQTGINRGVLSHSDPFEIVHPFLFTTIGSKPVVIDGANGVF
jgi:hypothetical protein